MITAADYLTSPGYPMSYYPSQKCVWVITAPGPNQRILINFNPHFDLEDRECKWVLRAYLFQITSETAPPGGVSIFEGPGECRLSLLQTTHCSKFQFQKNIFTSAQMIVHRDKWIYLDIGDIYYCFARNVDVVLAYWKAILWENLMDLLGILTLNSSFYLFHFMAQALPSCFVTFLCPRFITVSLLWIAVFINKYIKMTSDVYWNCKICLNELGTDYYRCVVCLWAHTVMYSQISCHSLTEDTDWERLS